MIINRKTDALLIIDIQNDFCPGGALAVAGGDEIVNGVNELAKQFDTIVFTQDNHPAGHASFASSHGQPAFSNIKMPYGDQTLWPDHCVQNTNGAAFRLELDELLGRATAVIRKGMNPAVDSYSAFLENDKSATGLGGFLRARGVERVFCVGLAYDFCVGFSAIDARKEGFEAVVVKDLTRAIAMPLGDDKTTVNAIEDEFSKSGVLVIDEVPANVLSRLIGGFANKLGG